MTEDELKEIEKWAKEYAEFNDGWIRSHFMSVVLEEKVPALCAALRQAWIELEGWRNASRSYELPSGSIVVASGRILDHPNGIRVLEQFDAAARKSIAQAEQAQPQEATE